jgi:hypothetical protein
MSQQGRWPASKNAKEELEHKLGESIWWLVVLADRKDVSVGSA